METREEESLVSIGLPVFNGSPFLKHVIDSLLSQTYSNIELLISDNASTDETEDICKRMQELDSRVKYRRNDTNIGALANWNEVFHWARGRYFMWAAHDDQWEPDYIKELVTMLEADPSTVLAFSHYDNIDVTTGRVYPGKNLSRFSKPRTRLSRLLMFLLSSGSCGKTKFICGVIRRDTLERIGGIYAGTEGTEEWSPTMLTLFLLWQEGNFAIHDKVMFRKGFIPLLNFQDLTFCSFGDILKHYLAYRSLITRCDLNAYEGLILQCAAIENFLRSLGGNIVEKTLARLHHTKIFGEIYRRFRLHVPR